MQYVSDSRQCFKYLLHVTYLSKLNSTQTTLKQFLAQNIILPQLKLDSFPPFMSLLKIQEKNHVFREKRRTSICHYL